MNTTLQKIIYNAKEIKMKQLFTTVEQAKSYELMLVIGVLYGKTQYGLNEFLSKNL
jgi:hypothetical protein